MSASRLPAGYGASSRRGGEAFAWEPAIEWLASVWRRDQSLYAWAARQPNGKQLVGRGPVHAVPAPIAGPDGCARWVVRRYRRGGAVARLLRDRYWELGRTRPARELDASVHARARNVKTPAVVAGAVYRGAGFYRADLVTELVPDARTLAHEIFHGAASDVARATVALVRTGRLVRSLAQAGMLHADLNAGNVLIDRAGAAWAVDLDRCRVLHGRARSTGPTMLKRLSRSLRKLGLIHGRPLSHSEWTSLRAGFEEGP